MRSGARQEEDGLIITFPRAVQVSLVGASLDVGVYGFCHLSLLDLWPDERSVVSATRPRLPFPWPRRAPRLSPSPPDPRRPPSLPAPPARRGRPLRISPPRAWRAGER